MKRILLLLLLLPTVWAECVELIDGMKITEDTIACIKTYDVPSGITIAKDGITLDCQTSVLRGTVGESEIGIRAEHVNGIAIKNCNIITFNQGLYLKNVTNSLIEKNAMLKNRIGIRLLDSFENTIKDNSDKSFQLAVSAINSKYNIVMLGNKEIERAFCETNACNEYRDMNVCESGDFYCSKKCNDQNDNDCKSREEPKVETPAPVKSVDQLIEEVKAEVSEDVPTAIQTKEETEQGAIPIAVKIVIYLCAYLIGLLIVQVSKKK